jgi:hypothetical protein
MMTREAVSGFRFQVSGFIRKTVEENRLSTQLLTSAAKNLLERMFFVFFLKRETWDLKRSFLSLT